MLGIKILSKVVSKKTREKQELDFFLNEKHTLWFWDCSMSGFPKGFWISKARLVNVFLEKVFLCNMQCNARVRRTTCYAIQHGVGEQNDMA